MPSTSTTPKPPDDDLALLHRVAARDRRAFEALYHLYYRRLFAFLFKLTRRGELVEEVLNDVMMAVWTGAARFDGRSRPSTWVFGIAYHKAMKALARAAAPGRRGLKDRHDLHDFDNLNLDRRRPAEEPQSEGGPDSLLTRRELASTLGKALHTLSPEHRAVVELTYYYELSYPEIAEIVGCPVNTVKTRMFYARRRLREVLPGLGVSSHAG